MKAWNQRRKKLAGKRPPLGPNGVGRFLGQCMKRLYQERKKGDKETSDRAKKSDAKITKRNRVRRGETGTRDIDQIRKNRISP